MRIITLGFGGRNIIVQGYLEQSDHNLPGPNPDPPEVIEPTGPQVTGSVLVGASDLQYIYNGNAITLTAKTEYKRKIKQREGFTWSERLADRFDDVNYYD